MITPRPGTRPIPTPTHPHSHPQLQPHPHPHPNPHPHTHAHTHRECAQTLCALVTSNHPPLSQQLLFSLHSCYSLLPHTYPPYPVFCSLKDANPPLPPPPPHCFLVWQSCLQRTWSVCCSVLQCVVVSCSVVQCGAVQSCLQRTWTVDIWRNETILMCRQDSIYHCN